jgi:uncharacterized protein YjiS (DUF1127 family)
VNSLPGVNGFAAFDEVTFSDGSAPVIFARHVPAGNDPVSPDNAREDNVALTLWAPVAGNMLATPTAWELYHATRAYRSYTLAEIIRALAEAAVERFSDARNRWLQRRQARSTRMALAALDDHLLRAVGLQRSEIDLVKERLEIRVRN